MRRRPRRGARSNKAPPSFPAMAFMFASANLVIELGVVLWILMGWRFVLAEFAGAFLLIGLVWLMVRWIMP